MGCRFWCLFVVGGQRDFAKGGVEKRGRVDLGAGGAGGRGGEFGGGAGGRGGGKSAHFCFAVPRVHPRGVQNGTDLSNY